MPTDSVSNSSSFDLQSTLDNQSLRETYGELLELSLLLSACIIDSAYVIPDSLVRPIKFTALGNSIRRRIAEERPRFKPNELSMAIFLSYGCADGLLVDESTDLDALRRAITVEITKGKILLPYILGRELHDVAANLYPRKTSLDNRETINLLRQLPVGIFQAGYSVTGPYGCLASLERRTLPASRAHEVPGYLCADETCDEAHSISLTTGRSAVSKTRRYVDEYLSKNHAASADDNARLISNACIEMDNPFRLTSYEKLIDTISDGLSTEETRIVADTLLRKIFRESGVQQDLSRKLGAVIGNPTEFVDCLNKAQLMQIILLSRNDEIVEAIDRSVLEGKIQISGAEYRGAKMARWGSGIYGLRAEIGELGVRFAAPTRSGIVALRLLELLHHLYFSSGVSDASDLRYLLDDLEDMNEQEILGFAVRRFAPEAALRQLVIGAKRTAVEAGIFMGVYDSQELHREDLLRRLLWKLGTTSTSSIFADLNRIESFESELNDAVRLSGTEDSLRGHISNLFAGMEDALSRTLTFTVWALTNDHYLDTASFIYDHEKDISIVVDLLDSRSPTQIAELALKKDGKNTIVPLAAAFSRLAKALKSYDSESHKRPNRQLPAESRCTPKPFAFNYTVPFLNLTPESQVNIIRTLQDIGQSMQDITVVKVRNSTVHGNNEFPSTSEISLAVEKISSVRRLMTSSGLYPQVFALDETVYDALGNSRVLYRNGENSVELFHPSWTVAPGLPHRRSQVIIVQAATMSSAGPLRFSLASRPGGDPYWADWPKRWDIVSTYTTAPEHRTTHNRIADDQSVESAG